MTLPATGTGMPPGLDALIVFSGELFLVADVLVVLYLLSP